MSGNWVGTTARKKVGNLRLRVPSAATQSGLGSIRQVAGRLQSHSQVSTLSPLMSPEIWFSAPWSQEEPGWSRISLNRGKHQPSALSTRSKTIRQWEIIGKILPSRAQWQQNRKEITPEEKGFISLKEEGEGDVCYWGIFLFVECYYLYVFKNEMSSNHYPNTQRHSFFHLEQHWRTHGAMYSTLEAYI